jgi:protein transport protein SEC31
MVAKASIPRSGAFAWSPVSTVLASGTVAGALDESFSNESKLELWDPFPLQPDQALAGVTVEPHALATVNCTARHVALTPSQRHKRADTRVDSTNWLGVLSTSKIAQWACWQLEWNPVNFASGIRPRSSLRTDNRSEPRFYQSRLAYFVYEALCCSRTSSIQVQSEVWTLIKLNLTSWLLELQTERFVEPLILRASTMVCSQIWVWDLNTPEKPYSPGTRSRNLQDITSLAWNKQVPHILSTASSSGYTVVWDLRNKREVVALNFAAVQQPQGPPGWMGQQQGARRGISAVSWHPENVCCLFQPSGIDN